MRNVVVDASVAIKWFVPEIHSIAALRLLESGSVFFAPDLILPELGNTLWKKVRRGDISAADALEILAAMDRTGIEIDPSATLMSSAIELAVELDRSVYDCVYLALAIARDCAVVTADRKFLGAVTATALASHIVWIEDVL